jgi:predicted amidohydrolase
VVAIRTKTLLPTYDVFDEDRYFEPASENAVIHWEGRRLGLTICEDIWNDDEFGVHRRYRPDPAAALVASGAEILINLSASLWPAPGSGPTASGAGGLLQPRGRQR